MARHGILVEDRAWEEDEREYGAGAAGRQCMSMHYPKDYDYFIALYTRVVKFACHFNNWLPAGAGLYRASRLRLGNAGVWAKLDAF